ncbi:MAG: HAD family hydrolase, partial [Verrucomicrobiae bacterium]|nr:HAD family hydrolase [Verrucomicrobiae bacterium]
LDGTLLDTLADLAASGNAVMRGRGLPEHPVEAFRRFVGDGTAAQVYRLFPEDRKPDPDEHAAALAEYMAAYETRWNATTRPYDGIPALLDALAAAGVRLAVLSNKAHAFTQRCMAEFFGAWHWDFVFGLREGFPRKPDPAGALEIAERLGLAPRDCVFLGDSGIDMETGRRAGMTPVGALWGFRDADELRAAGAARLLAKPGDLLELAPTQQG